jgi:hypothetical protein
LRRAALTLALILAGCGGAHHGAAAPRPVARGYLGAADLQRDLGNGFRAGLDRLAVMEQPRDDASDLGQERPTGLLDRVTCEPAAGKPAKPEAWPWRCTVRWQTSAGRAKTTRYAVRLFPTRCFAAGATPALPPRRDPAIASYSEHPLNTVISVKKGC